MASFLILGGTSWLGGVIASEAVARGHVVACLARGESGTVPDGVELVVADRTQASAYEALSGGTWDVVVDVSRQPGQVASAVEALGEHAGHWVFVSTGSVYVDQSGWLSEDSELLPALDGPEAGPEQYGEGKVACEEVVRSLPHHLIVRAGLIGGPGDLFDRLGHYVARFALAGQEPVLVPAVADQPMQVIDVRDLAGWIVRSAEAGTTGVVHGVGEPTTVGELIALSAEIAGGGNPVEADPEWLLAHDVQQWMGPRSLPLWLPPSHHGMGQMDDSFAVELGLQRRPLSETLRDTLTDERARGLHRDRRAGLTRPDELALLATLG